MKSATVSVLCGIVCLLPYRGAGAQTREIRVTIAQDHGPSLELRERLRLGSEDGPEDAFGRVMDATLDRRGRLLIVDNAAQHVAVFDLSGRRLATVGRSGEGPGEFQSPWTVSVDPADSVFVWDLGLGRISVFSPELQYTRSFRIPPPWVPGPIGFFPDGSLLMGGYTRGQSGSLHRVGRDGGVLTTYPVGSGADGREPGVAYFESSLLGGSATLDGDTIVYANKSPYEITFLSGAGTVVRRCHGDPAWTTPPADAVTVERRRASLNWNKYVHVAHILTIEPGLYLILTYDPVRGALVTDLVTRACRIVRRTEMPGALGLRSRTDSSITAIRTLDYHEVIVYDYSIRGGSPP